jgi:hypothetical protein
MAAKKRTRNRGRNPNGIAVYGNAQVDALTGNRTQRFINKGILPPPMECGQGVERLWLASAIHKALGLPPPVPFDAGSIDEIVDKAKEAVLAELSVAA